MSIAQREDDRANELTHWPQTRPADPARASEPPMVAAWFGTWDTAAEHQRLASAHRSAAAQIEAEYEAACADASHDVVSVSPLQRYGLGGSDVPNGVMVVLSKEAGPPDHLLSTMRCHRAWMMLGRTDMDDCPLDIANIHVSAQGDEQGISLTITVPDPAQVDELRRRTARELEVAKRRGL